MKTLNKTDVKKNRGTETSTRLEGNAEIKAMVERMGFFLQNRSNSNLPNADLPNYLWIAERGGEIPVDIVEMLAEYLYEEKMIEFSGDSKYLHFKLHYSPPSPHFSELIRLHNAISQVAGYRRYFKGIVCVDINEWIRFTDEKLFHVFLEYIASQNDKIMTIFCISTGNDNDIDNIKSSLMSNLRFETIRFKPLTAERSVQYLGGYFIQQGYHLEDDAKKTLKESFEKMICGRHFNGYVTVQILAEKILFDLMASNKNHCAISANMIAKYNKDSTYAKCIVGKTNSIGFKI